MGNFIKRTKNNKSVSEQVHSQKIAITFDIEAIKLLQALGEDKYLLDGLTIGNINNTEIKWHTKQKSLPKSITGLNLN